MLYFRCLMVVLFVVSVSGCATVSIDSDFDPAADFSSLKTYGWLTDPRDAASVGSKDFEIQVPEPLIDARIRAAIDSELSGKGYRKVAPSEADFRVVYYLGVRDVRDIQIVERYHGYSHYHGYYWHGMPYTTVVTEPIVFDYKEGRMVVDIVHSKQDKLMWRGYAQGYYSDYDSASDRNERINTAVHDMLEQFPPH